MSQPAKLSTQLLAALLRDMAERVEAHDSFDGSLVYEATNERGVFAVHAAYRIGNSEGQGGMRSVGEL